MVTGVIPLSERWWLLPHLRDREDRHEQRPGQETAIEKVMRERPLAFTEAAIYRDALRKGTA